VVKLLRKRPATDADLFREAIHAEVRAKHPKFGEAVLADARVTATYRGERADFHSTLDAIAQIIRLAVVSDAFVAQIAYRGKARLQALGVPLVPRLLHRVAMMTAQVSIGDPVVVHPGLYLFHGQVVMDGLVEIGPGALIAPWVTIGLVAPNIQGPTIGAMVSIGTGAKVLGQVTVGNGAKIGANSVVLQDVPPGRTAVGSPARIIGTES
jgi:serine O-acetyltransferase